MPPPSPHVWLLASEVLALSVPCIYVLISDVASLWELPKAMWMPISHAPILLITKFAGDSLQGCSFFDRERNKGIC